MTHFRIVTGTPGTDRERISQKLEESVPKLRGLKRIPTVKIRTVERYIPKLCRKDLYLPDTEKDPLLVILAQLPQDQIRCVWQDAFEEAAEDALKDGPDLAIVMTSLSYYRKETYEFYCPGDLKRMQQWHGALSKRKGIATTGPILTLIDDIYDLYSRLSGGGHVFDIRQLVEEELEDNPGSESDRYKKAMSLVIQCLVRVLEWRESEIQAAAALGAVWDVQSLTVAVKHPIETVVRLLLGKASTDFGLGRTLPVYLSHPISAPRKDNAAKGSWPPFVREFDEFVRFVRENPVRDLHITPIMPTAIDEYRFLNDRGKLLPWLAPRWPLPGEGREGTREELLCCAADGHASYGQYEKECLQTIFDPPLDNKGARVGLPHCPAHVKGMLVADAEVSGMLRTLESLITLQMANRDHLLVRQCPGLLLYRPLSDKKPRFTGGVRAEIRDQNQLRKFEPNLSTYGRPMVFVHSSDDVRRFFAPKSDAVKHIAQEMVTRAKKVVSGRDEYTVSSPSLSTLAKALIEPGDPAPTWVRSTGNSSALRVGQ